MYGQCLDIISLEAYLSQIFMQARGVSNETHLAKLVECGIEAPEGMNTPSALDPTPVKRRFEIQKQDWNIFLCRCYSLGSERAAARRKHLLAIG